VILVLQRLNLYLLVNQIMGFANLAIAEITGDYGVTVAKVLSLPSLEVEDHFLSCVERQNL